MHIDNKRLLTGLQDCINGLTSATPSPQEKALQMAATVILGELARRENQQQISDNHARGVGLAKVLAEQIRSTGKLSAKAAGEVAALPLALDLSIGIAPASVIIAQLRNAICLLLADSGYPASDKPAINATVNDLINWETEQYKLETIAPLKEKKLAAMTQQMMEHVIRGRGGDFSAAKVTWFNPLYGGFSKSTILFDVEDDKGETHHLAARIAQDIKLLDLPGQDVVKEYHLLKYLSPFGLRIAKPQWLVEDKSICGLRFFVSERASGRNWGTAVSSEPLSKAQVRSLAEVLVGIHGVHLDPDDETLKRSQIDARLATQPLAEVMRDYVKMWHQQWKLIDGGAYPAIDAVFQWLLANVPQNDDVPVLVHGDYALHNILIDGDRVTAALDWEIAHIGDRARDISWLLATIGKHVTAEDFMQAYVEAGGRPVSRFQLKYYEILSQLGLMIVDVDAQKKFMRDREVGPHYCTLGLGFMHPPASAMVKMIQDAEALR
jgi:aminoglycoside phosphotransferase (APT) family kinase protein